MVEFNPYDWKTHEDPYPIYRALRREAPAYRHPELQFWALSQHADVLTALRDTETYSSAQGVSLEDVGPSASAIMSFLGMDPPEHDQMRAVVWRRFSKRQVKSLEHRIRELAVHYLDTFVDQGVGDFIQDFAARLPMDVICELFDIPQEDRDTIREWADAVVAREDGDSGVPKTALKGAANLFGYFSVHVHKRRKQSAGDDLTSLLVAAEVEGKPLTDPAIMAILFLMSIAGNETTTKLLGNAMYWLSKHPEQRERVTQDHSLIKAWVEETIRYDNSSQMVARTLTRDVELHGKIMGAGSKVALLLGSANRDEAVFEDPDTFNIERNTRAILSFGHGVHYCLGANLARLEAIICLEEVMKRLPDFEIDYADIVRVHSPNVRGFGSMPISFST